MFRALALYTLLGLGFAQAPLAGPATAEPPAVTVRDDVGSRRATFHTVEVDGIQIFYRESGRPDLPTLVLLHGYPSSSHMFRELMPRLSAKFHVVAPDYPGFGYSEAPPDEKFKPTFANLTTVMEHFVEHLGVRRFSLYIQDFGGPVGLRMAAHHPEWIDALVIQNANAYDEGLAPVIKAGNERRAQHPSSVDDMGFELGQGLADLLYKTGARRPERLSPDAWTFDLWAMQQPGHKRIAAALLNDYHTNVAAYPQWQAYLREHQPRTLVLWGKGDPVFLVPGAEAYRRDLKNVDIHLLDASHFALEEEVDGIAEGILAFFARRESEVR